MRLRRCQFVMLELRERLGVDLQLLLADQPRLAFQTQWVALAAHLEHPVTLDAQEITVIGRLSASEWITLEEAGLQRDDAALAQLREKGLVFEATDSNAAHDADTRLRGCHWHGLAAVAHRHLRWSGVDSIAEQQRFAELFDGEPMAHLHDPPPPVFALGSAQPRVALPRAASSPLLDLLARRVTCRNFDQSRPLPQAAFAFVLDATFRALAQVEVTGVSVLKKGTPSAGGLHPTEAYLLIQNVEGVAPGLHHYHALDHALEPLQTLDAADVRRLASRLLAVQDYLADAPAIVVYVSRFERNFWKYRQHAKAYRAAILDVGHLSQTLYLAATERGLGAFFTAAVNEVDIEQAFGLDPMQQGVIGVGGFGRRGPTRHEIEFDPLHAVWPD
ncbi:MAG TPA: putative peptide maturation dehydrogenase [Dokdonella sp.]|uniref:putative peptide maturation dehydrogenase n=1 Tax=Dokdonella sp. TaxID=2291710 RepID=UPI002BF105E1|nr:putative peptide maturation dehydrogenase [Dokdonella sp.]HUD43705.1 putative peptide maturation dehydrogenase [Dokdonella sp.]